MLPRPSKPFTAAPRGSAPSQNLRDSFLARLTNYRREMQPHHARWEKSWQEAHRLYWQNITVALALRSSVKRAEHEYHVKDYRPDGRLNGALCCDFIHWRRVGRSADSIIREFHRRAQRAGSQRQPQRIPSRAVDRRGSTEESVARLYAGCYQMLLRDKRPGYDDFSADQSGDQPTLSRMGGMRIPHGFLPAYEQAEKLNQVPADEVCGTGAEPGRESGQVKGHAALLQTNRENYLAAIAKFFAYLAPACPPLLYVLLELSGEAQEHAVVCDFSAQCPGIFDPHYGFMALPAGTEMRQFAPLMAKLAYRYSASALVAFQDCSKP